MRKNREHRGHGRYRLTDTGTGLVLGVCDEVEGLFREPRRGTYDLFGWVPDGPEVRGWVGSRLWLVPEDGALDAWLLEDAQSLGPYAPDGLVLTGLDDHEGPPEGYRGRVRLHDRYRWLGSCQEFARVMAPEDPAPPLVLRGFAPGDPLRWEPRTSAGRATSPDEAGLEIWDRRGEPLADRLLRPKVRAWQPSSLGPDLIDVELDGELEPVPAHARPVWERWLAGPPGAPGEWAGLDSRQRAAWLDVVRERGCLLRHERRPGGQTYELDGRHIFDEPALYLALGEAVNGPGGYFGGCLDALADCLRGDFGYTGPATLLWRDAATAREHLSCVLTPEGESYDLVTAVIEVLTEGGMRVTLA
ncbi:barstar family protein [Streptomyces sp. M41]|uniref:barstar family protein n=1 Tax=Streptomyces sp. M41 TaxID=3059412 RepID=UPI00374D5C84